MRFRWTLGVACAVLMAAMVVARAEDKKEDGEKKPRAAKLTAPWSKLSGLSDEQKQQIREIHGKANDEVKAIREKENTDIMALLTDEQKKELAGMKEKDAVEKKAKSADDSSKKEPAGQ